MNEKAPSNQHLIKSIKDLQQKLEAKRGYELNMLIGVDGFVDEINHVVDKWKDSDTFARVETISDLGARIQKAAGLSANIEFVTTQTKLGGNGPILSNALIEYGVHLTYVGALGKTSIHPVFNTMAEKSHAVYSLSDPGHTDALEFNDGKLLLGKLFPIKEVTWERFKEVVGEPQKIASIISECHLFGMENWTMIPYMSQIWEGLIEEVFPLLPDHEPNSRPYAFFDLADPEKRTKEDILHAMHLIRDFEKKFKTILGLNEKEVYEIAEVYGILPDDSVSSDERLKKIVTGTYDKLGITCLVVHPTKEAVCVIDGTYYQTEGPYCEKPVLTTGAGDNFNAGFCLGQALGLDPQSSLLLGTATSGCYVRHAKSPTYNDVLKFLSDWENGAI